jgi:hypothetical protein
MFISVSIGFLINCRKSLFGKIEDGPEGEVRLSLAEESEEEMGTGVFGGFNLDNHDIMI